MSLNLQCYGRFSGRIDNELTKGGSLETPISISVDGEVYHRIFDIASNSNSIIYNDELGEFNYLFMASDLDCRVLVTDNASNTFAIVLKGVGVQAGSTSLSKYGVPIQLGSDRTTSNTVRINTLQAFNIDTENTNAKLFITVIK